MRDRDLNQEILIATMLKGDPKCAIPIKSIVTKTVSEEGDRTPIGTKGIVSGSLHYKGEDCYLVIFETDPPESFTFVVGDKITKEE